MVALEQEFVVPMGVTGVGRVTLQEVFFWVRRENQELSLSGTGGSCPRGL